jgi:dienelactone hydrolase
MRASHFLTSITTASALAAALLAPAGAQARGAMSQNIDIKSSDGVVLKATYYPAEKPGPGIVMLHACNMTRTSWAQLATDASAKGFHVLTLDFRGFGESGGDRFGMGTDQQSIIDTKWPSDVDAALAWLSSQPGVDKTKIGATGASCGVNQAVQLAKRHPEVKTVVMLSGGVNEGARLFLRDSPGFPVLAAASRGDSGAVDQMRWILGWSRNPSNKFIEYKKAGHGTEMFAVEKGLEPAILDWFAANLRDAPAKVSATAAAKPTATEEFWATLTSPGGVAKARQMYDAAKKAGKHAGLLSEADTNILGYTMMRQDNNAKDALEVFKLNADAFPDSANTYDSLSDAYLALGNREESLRNAEKALEMLPKDTEAADNFKTLVRESAETKIKELKKSTSDHM